MTPKQELDRAYYQLKIKHKICVNCKEPAVNGFKRCAKHLEYSRNKSTTRQNRLRAEGLCVACGRSKPAPDRAKCYNCIELHNENRRSNRALAKLRRDNAPSTICNGQTQADREHSQAEER